MRLLLLTAFAFLASAQEATIVGTVTDPSGAMVPNVSITITNLDTGMVRRVVSNAVGQYVVPDLHIGRYRTRAEAPGFKAVEHEGIVLAVGDRVRVDTALIVGPTQEKVTVEANPLAVQSDSGEVSEVVSGQQISQLATNGRSVTSLVLLTPGASTLMPDFQAPAAFGTGTVSVSFNGLRPGHNMYLVDGAETVDRGGGGIFSIQPSIDAIAEFRVLSSNYGAQYGLSSAGTMAMVLKSGSRQFHGGAWEFVRNEAFDATNFFTHQADKLRLNTFGFNLSGPLAAPRRSKSPRTFFLYNMEWRKLVQATAINVAVPAPGAYGGVFPASTPIHVPAASQLAPSIMSRFTALGLTPGQQFPNNTIPPSLLDPNAQLLLKAGIFPAPTRGTQYLKALPATTDVREELIRVDHQFSEALTVFGHWISDQETQLTATPPYYASVPTVGSSVDLPSASGVVHTVHTIRPNLINESALNYGGNRIAIDPTGLYQAPPGLAIQDVFPSNSLKRIPGIYLLGSTCTGYSVGAYPWREHFGSYQLRDDVSWVRGAHQFQFGGSWDFFTKTQDLWGLTQGSFSFSGIYSGNDFSDFLLGFSKQYSQLALQDSRVWHNFSWAAYAQDNWRANRRLTLNLGLRWDGVPHAYEANHNVANFYPRLYDPSRAAILGPGGTSISPSSPGLGTSPNPALSSFQFYLNGIGIPGTNGIPAGLVRDHWAAFGPRAGFAYDLSGGGKTVVRGGFGAMYERVAGNDTYFAAPNQPFSASIMFNGVSLSNPGTSLLTGQAPTSPIPVGSISGLAEGDYKLPVSYQYSAGIQRLVGPEAILSVAYVGNQSRHQNRVRHINLPDPSVLPALIQNSTQYNNVVPYRGFGSITLKENAGNSHYNGLQISLRARVREALSLQGAYTLSRAVDPLGDDLATVSNPYDASYDIGPSAMDRTHIGTIGFVYDLPLLKQGSHGAAGRVLRGWELSGIGLMQSGLPLPIILGGSQGANGLLSAVNRPDRIAAITYPQSVAQWFNPAAFGAPAMGAWGNLKKGAVRGPGRHNWNLALFKNFPITERRASLELRIETFNTLNHVQFRDIDSSYSDRNFGQVMSAWDPRVFQFGAKLKF